MERRVVNRRMILCAGMQSGGTTLVSWCFLQRRDTNGVLDMPSSLIRMSFDKVQEPIVWCKMTVASFRWLDVYDTYRDAGWLPEPLLVVRDVRSILSSLLRKDYGFNGNTAEDPPLRMRFRRFLHDWQLFRREAWPILKFEDLVQSEDAALRDLCRAMSLEWDGGMISWPKKRHEIAYARETNQTFENTIERGSLAGTILRHTAEPSVEGLHSSDLRWLEDTFSDYNQVHGYPRQILPADSDDSRSALSEPTYQGSSRDRLYRELKRLHAANVQLQLEDR